MQILTAPCYECGAEAVLEGLCSRCYQNKHPLVQVRSPLSLIACRRCGAVRTSDGWIKLQTFSSDPDKITDRQIEILLEQETNILGLEVETSYVEEKKLDRVTHIRLNVSGKSHSSLPTHDESYPLEIRFEFSTCASCTMMSGGYHEAILQVRADDRILTETEEDVIHGLVTDLTIAEYGNDARAFVIETSRDKYGLDFKVGSEHLCRRIADQLESGFLAQRKENYKLIGQDRGGKKKYRITILIRLQRFSQNDFVLVEGTPCQVVSMGKGGLGCYNLLDGCSFTINQKSSKWRSLEFLAEASERRQYMIVSKVQNQPIQLMDSVTFEMHEIDSSVFLSNVAAGDTIYALSYSGRILPLPS
ncbi:MAG: hypothetical protein EAX81_04185 [Candidatus Thorarchaeota archaeon]|nr:hypothetical protein [Candidatus Thorarchaeota archaeon]